VADRVTRLRLATVNLFSGRSVQDGAIVADRLTAALGSLDADLVALQEVDRCQPRSGLVDQSALAAAAIGAPVHPDHLRFVPTVLGTPGEPGWRGADGASGVAVPPDGPSYGIALASRLPVLRWHVLPLAAPRGRFPIPVPSRPPRVLLLPDEPRAAVAAELAEPRITVACTHLSFVPGVNVRQLRQVRRWLAGLPGPVLLLGDLNLPGRMAVRFSGGHPLVSAPTFPVQAPRIQLDHALALGPLPAGATARGELRTLPIGDHAAVLLDLTLPDPTPPGGTG
jgi:endonuclease/exonuclease/phosphatase family metal-dependent hydrolase